jgi:undecaprenyl-diphosphatase
MKYQQWIVKVDSYIYRWLESKELQNRSFGKRFMQGMVWIAKYSPIFMIAVIFLFGLYRGRFQSEFEMIWSIPTCIVAGGISRVWSGVLGYLIPRTRPFATYGSVPLIDHTPNESFPSNHAAGGFALAISFYHFEPRFGTVFLLWATCLAISRIFVRLHYFSDVVSGALIGVLAAKLSLALFSAFIS